MRTVAIKDLKHSDFFHGQKFEAVFEDGEYLKISSGRVTIEDKKVFLCQNDINGFSCKDKQGFKYSYKLMRSSGTIVPFVKVEGLKLEQRMLAQSELKSSDFYHGQKFIAKIRGAEVEGKVTIEYNKFLKGDRIYLCQDKVEGTRCNNKQGFKYSFVISVDGILNLQEVENLKLEPKKPDVENSIDPKLIGLSTSSSFKFTDLSEPIVQRHSTATTRYLGRLLKDTTIRTPSITINIPDESKNLFVTDLDDESEEWLLSNFTEDLSLVEVKDDPRQLIFKVKNYSSLNEIKRQIKSRKGRIIIG